MLCTIVLQKLTTAKYDKLVETFGNDVLYSDYIPSSHDEMIESFLYMGLRDKIRFEYNQFTKDYLRAFERIYIYIKTRYTPEVLRVFFDIFQKNPVDQQIKYMSNSVLLMSVLSEINNRQA